MGTDGERGPDQGDGTPRPDTAALMYGVCAPATSKFRREARMKSGTLHREGTGSKFGNALVALALLCMSATAQAQPVVGRIFPASEFAARRAAVMKSIGDGV